MSLSKEETLKNIGDRWESWFIPGLQDFVRVPNLTTMVDPEYLTNGLLQKSMECVDGYIKKLEIEGLSRHVFSTEDGLPLVCYVVEPTQGCTKNIMVYGHLDKQPYGTGWDEDLSPTDPVIKGDLMYGRGSSDDGYAPFSCMLGIKDAQLQGKKMPRIVLVLELEEESGSPNLVSLLKIAKDCIGTPDYMFCLDSGAFDYESLWITSSLRGICIIDLTVQIGKDGYHSGEVGGVVPETFRVVRTLLDRLDSSETGKPCEELMTELPKWKEEEAERMVKQAGRKGMCDKYAICEGGKYCSEDDLKEMYLNNQWRANLSVTGADGLPPIQMAGNVVRSSTSLRLSMRLPPNMDPKKGYEEIVKKLTTDVPYGAKITIKGGHTGSGWCMKDLHPWLDEQIKKSGTEFFDGKPAGSYGMGGSIPFLSELEKMYPSTQIVAFGLLGPNSNAHGPNEMINLTYAKKLTCALSHVMQAVAEKA